MDDYLPAERRYASPSTQRRTGEIWKARLGLGVVVSLSLVTAAVLFRLAGLGVGAATSPLQALPTSTPIGGVRTTPSGAFLTPVPTASPATPLSGTPAPSGTPGASVTAQPGATPTRVPGAPTPTTVITASREHTVASGDTLGAIAARYATTVDVLVRLNAFKDRNQTLNIGQKLKVP